MNQTTITPEDMAKTYWRKKRVGALSEVSEKLIRLKDATACTLAYWKKVHVFLLGFVAHHKGDV
jgi:hypothetical protein